MYVCRRCGRSYNTFDEAINCLETHEPRIYDEDFYELPPEDQQPDEEIYSCPTCNTLFNYLDEARKCFINCNINMPLFYTNERYMEKSIKNQKLFQPTPTKIFSIKIGLDFFDELIISLRTQKKVQLFKSETKKGLKINKKTEKILIKRQWYDLNQLKKIDANLHKKIMEEYEKNDRKTTIIDTQ